MHAKYAKQKLTAYMPNTSQACAKHTLNTNLRYNSDRTTFSCFILGYFNAFVTHFSFKALWKNQFL